MADGGVEFTTCSICLDPFNEPRILPCGHSFCTECLKSIIGRGNRKCPDCRKDIPNQQVKAFPIVYSLVAAVNAPRSTMQTSLSEKCTKHNLPKEFFCQAESCSVAICKKCWTSDHTRSPHNVVPIEAELETMLNRVTLNTDPIKDFQKNEKTIFSQFTKHISVHESALKKTEDLVQYQLKCTSSTSTSELGNYEATIMEKCMSKQQDIQTARKNWISLFDAADARLKELITHVQKNCGQHGSKHPITIPIKQNPKVGLGTLQSVTEVTQVEHSQMCDDVAFDSTSEHVFISYGNSVDVYNLQLRKLYSFKHKKGVVIKSIAISGNGTLYVTCKQRKQRVISAVDKKSGEVIRNIHSDNGFLGRISAVGNRLVSAHELINQMNTVEVCVYDNETLTKTLQLQTYSTYCLTLASLDYLLYFQLEGNNSFQLVILNIAHSNMSQKCVVHLDGLKYKTSSFVWIGNKSCNNEEVTSGYLFITDSYSRPLVYEIDLSTVEDGTTLSPLNISFNFKQEYTYIEFISVVGNESILCKSGSGYNTNITILKLECG